MVALWNIIERCHALNHATDDEHILFLDGTDTVFQAPTSQLCPLLIENSIPSFSVPSETCGRMMSFASEKYPAPLRKIFGHLNSGGWIGRARALLEWFPLWANAPFLPNGRDDSPARGERGGEGGARRLLLAAASALSSAWFLSGAGLASGLAW